MRHPVGLLDTNAVILLPRLVDALTLPEEPRISTITLAELSVGPLVAATAEERAFRQAHLQQAEADFEPLPFDAGAARAFGRAVEPLAQPRPVDAVDGADGADAAQSPTLEPERFKQTASVLLMGPAALGVVAVAAVHRVAGAVAAGGDRSSACTSATPSAAPAMSTTADDRAGSDPMSSYASTWP